MPDAGKSCRLKAVALFESLMATEKNILDDSGADFILLADLLRGARTFDFAIAACERHAEIDQSEHQQGSAFSAVPLPCKG